MTIEDSALADVITPDTFTPEQWAERHKSRTLAPEAELYAAILCDAVDCLRYRDIQTSRGKKLYRDAWTWLHTDKQDEVGLPVVTAAICCEAMGIDLEYLRRGLRHYTPVKLYGHVVARDTSGMTRPRASHKGVASPAAALQIVEMYRANATIPRIRSAVGVSYGTVYKVINQFLTPEERRPPGRTATIEAKRERIRQLRAQGMGIHAICAREQVSSKTVYKALGKRGRVGEAQHEATNAQVAASGELPDVSVYSDAGGEVSGLPAGR